MSYSNPVIAASVGITSECGTLVLIERKKNAPQLIYLSQREHGLFCFAFRFFPSATKPVVGCRFAHTG